MAVTTSFSREDVVDVLKEVIDPEVGINVVDLGLVYGIDVEGTDARVTMTLTTPGCPLHESICEAVEQAMRFSLPGIGTVAVDLVWEPRWTPARISEQGLAELG